MNEDKNKTLLLYCYPLFVLLLLLILIIMSVTNFSVVIEG